ncbi:MAG: DUF3011 domain-containing protein [Rudaea sp.]
MDGSGKNLIAAALLIAIGGTTSAFAQDRSVVCESIDNGRNSCPIRTDGRVRMVEQFSKTPCVKHDNWDVEDNGVWVSGGCRARFESMSRREHEDRRDDDRRGDDRRDDQAGMQTPPPDGASIRLQAKCAHRVAEYQRISTDDAVPQGSRVVGDGLFEVNIGTPQGTMVCTVDQDGNVRGVMQGQ